MLLPIIIDIYEYTANIASPCLKLKPVKEKVHHSTKHVYPNVIIPIIIAVSLSRLNTIIPPLQICLWFYI